ncbi:MAG: ribonuclease H-like domain-containing protein [Desulfobacca sp.]|nr:ribonuclease H-like domain-containing protein [Desulfobacca sp.]
MLKRTFIHLSGIGERTEAHFWRQGLQTWEDFLAVSRVRGLSPGRLAWLQGEVRQSLARIHDLPYFAARLPVAEYWRLFRHFRQGAAYLDIETTGSNWPELTITVIGLYDGSCFQQFVQGENLRQFPSVIQSYSVLISFNGTQFDLPVLRANFPGLNWPPVHIDLRFVLARLGYRGGLKRIEPQLGVHRPPDVEGMDGYMAVRLWDRYQRGDYTARDLLLRYNREDVINLETLMIRSYELSQTRVLALATRPKT